MTRRYLVVIEKGKRNYGAYAPDVPGCVSTGKTVEETKANMREALLLHFASMKEDREPLPRGATTADYVELPDRIPSESDEVRDYVRVHYIEPARQAGKDFVTVRAKDVHKALGFVRPSPLVCRALSSRNFSAESRATLVELKGPEDGTQTVLKFALNGRALRSKKGQ